MSRRNWKKAGEQMFCPDAELCFTYMGKEGEQMFCPDAELCFTYMGKVLTRPHEKRAWLEGWCKAKEQHDSMEKEREKELTDERKDLRN